MSSKKPLGNDEIRATWARMKDNDTWPKRPKRRVPTPEEKAADLVATTLSTYGPLDPQAVADAAADPRASKRDAQELTEWFNRYVAALEAKATGPRVVK
jgi:hypothetical protein